jgi:TonB family protein
LVLASDEDGGTLDALRFSLASEIVELVVLTADEAFLQTFRDAVGGARRLWHVPSADKVSDLLLAGEVGIVVLDVQSLNEAASVFIGQIKRQFPDLVVVVAGNRDDETSLARLISAGFVYRFIHKPVSPARAKLFVEAAIKRHDEQRRLAAETPRSNHGSRPIRAWVITATIGLLGLIAAVTWLNRPPQSIEAAKPAAPYVAPPQPTPLAADVHEQLLARAENALLEERLDEAAAAIETARAAGVDAGRIAFLTAQLAKSREQERVAQAQIQARPVPRVKSEAKADEDRLTPLLNLAAQRIDEGRFLGSDRDNARYFVLEALRADPENAAVQEAKRSLASRLLTEARGAIERRDFVLAASLIEGAGGLAAATNIELAQSLLATARKQADLDAGTALLKNANDRLQQDRLIEPNDSAKYFLLSLRRLDPGNAGLASAMQDLGSRILAKARGAVGLEQYDAARSWLEEAEAIGFTSADMNSVRHDLDAAIAKQKFLTTVVPAGQLKLLKSTQPVYPIKAEADKTEGWVELNFTVSETGQVKEVSVHASSIPGVFDNAAVKAVSQWRYQPVLRDAKPIAVRTQIRIRFALP